MKFFHQKQVTFIGKSLLWSLLLYVAMMVVFNWDDVSNTVRGCNTITIVKPALTEPATPYIANPLASSPSIAATHAGVVRSIVAVLQLLSGASNSATH